jgi:hypothetical protein
MASARAEQKCPRKICARNSGGSDRTRQRCLHAKPKKQKICAHGRGEVTRRCMHKKKIFCMHTRPDSTKKNLARTGPAVLLSGSKQKKNLRAREVTGQRNGADRRCCLQSGSKKKKQNTARAAGEVTAQGVSACKRKLRAPQGGSDQTLLSPAESDQKAAASKIKKNSTLRAPQGK